MKVYTVEGGTGGGHEANPVFSVWSTEALARAELERLSVALLSQYYSQDSIDEFGVREVELDASADELFNWCKP